MDFRIMKNCWVRHTRKILPLPLSVFDVRRNRGQPEADVNVVGLLVVNFALLRVSSHLSHSPCLALSIQMRPHVF